MRAWLLAGLAVLLVAQPASALCTFYTDPKFPTVKPEVLAAHIRIELLDGYAVVEIEKTFRNPDANTAQVGDIIFPLPSEHAFITSLGLSVDGAWHNASIVDREEGRRNFSEAVNERRDASLLEHLGGTQYALRVTLPPQENRTLRVRYEEPLARVNGLFHYRYPLTEEALSEPRELTLELRARTASAFRDLELLSPPGQALDRLTEDSALLRLSARGKEQLQHDVVLRWATSREDEAQLFAHQADGSGHFVFRLVPGAATLAKAKPLPVDLMVLVDASGSMGKEGRLAQASEAVRQVLAGLGPDDRFQLAHFRNRVEVWNGQPMAPTPDHRESAAAAVRGLRAEGSTNLQEALATALRTLEEGRAGAQPAVVVISDGDATVGLRDGHAMVHALGDQNRVVGQDVVLHTLQVGRVEHQAQKFDPWGRRLEGAEPLLEVVAKESFGVGLPVNRSAELRTVLEGPGRVLLRNVTLAAEGAGATQVGPRRLALLQEGGEVLVGGRFVEPGPLQVVLRGEGAEGPVQLVFDLDTREAAAHPLAERLAAMVRLRDLLEEARVKGPSEERIAAIKAFAAPYGYVTPYTSLLVDLPARKAAPSTSAESQLQPAWGASAPNASGMALDGDFDERVDRVRSLLDHPLVQDREVDRYVLAGSLEHRAILERGPRLLAQDEAQAGIVEHDGEVVLFGSQAMLDAIAWRQGRFNLVPGADAAGLLVAALAAAGAVASRRRA